MWLADLGADVVKVERPGEGDDTRAFGPPFQEGESAYFMSINRGKKSVTLDLKNEAAQAVLWKLVEQSDVVLENFRPGALDRLGFSAQALLERNPKLIFASISGYGHTGLEEYVQKPGYDLVIQGLSGLASLTGEPAGAPHKVGVSIADLSSGLFALIGILAALHARTRTGRGQHVDVSMLDGTVSLLTFAAGSYFASGAVPRRMGNAHPSICPYETFAAADGYLNVACGNDALFRALCKVLQRPQWAADPDFQTNGQRVQHRERLVPALAELFATRAVDAWVALLEGAGIPCGPILGVDGALRHPQLAARGMVVEMEHPRAGPVRFCGTPIRFSDTPAGSSTPPPVLGADTEQVLRELAGLDDAAIAELRRQGAI